MNDVPRKTILLVDDEVLIAEAEAMMLEDHGYTVLKAHNGKKAVETALGDPSVDLVLMDVDLGRGMDGPEAARRILKARSLPIVFLTSHSEREMVDSVKCITRYGYVIKNSGDFVLLSSIDMAFELFDAHCRLEEHLREIEFSEERFRTAFDSVTAGMAITATDGRLLRVNGAFCAMLGYSMEEMGKLNFADLTHPDDRKISSEAVEALLKKGEKARHFRKRYVHKNGQVVWADVSAVLLRGSDGRPLHFVTHVQDISAQVEYEAALKAGEERYRAMFEKNRSIKLLIDPDTGNILDANPAACEFYGHPREVLLTLRVMDINILDEETVHAEMDLARSGKKTRFTFSHRLASGEERRVEVFSSPVDIEGKTVLYSIISDVTELYRTEEALKATRDRYRLLSENIHDFVWTMDAALNYNYASPSVERLLGYTPEEFLGLKLEQFIAPSSLDKVRDTLTRRKRDEAEGKRKDQIRYWKTQYLRKDGAAIWLETTTTPLRNPDGSLQGILGVSRDISDRVETEETLRESEARYRRLSENTPAVIYQFKMAPDGAFSFPYASPAIEGLTGLAAVEVMENPAALLGLMHPEDTGAFLESVRKSAVTLVQWGMTARFLVGGEEKWLEGHSTPERMADGSVLWDGFLFDITDRKRAEEDLRESRQMLAAVTDNVPGPIARFDRELRYTYTNKLYGLLYDRTGEGLIGRTMPEVIGPEAYGRADPFIKRALGGERVSYENFLSMPSGEKLYGLVTLSPDIDTEGRITGIYMVALDITERRKAEDDLRESMNNLNRSEKISGAGSWSWDIAADRFIASPEGLRLWGFGPDERPSFAEVATLIHPDDLPTAHDVLVNSLHTGEPYAIEIRIHKKDTGEVRHLLSVAEIEMSADGRASRVFGVNRDISDRVRADAALKRSEEKYRSLVEEINDVVYALDGEGVITFISSAIAKMTALTPGEITHRPFSDFIHPDDLTMVIERYKRYIDGDISPADFRISDGGGGYIWVRSSGNPVFIDGQFAGVRGALQNITEVKRAEKELREREEKFRAVAENSHNAVAVVDDGFRLTYVNDEFCRLSGYGRDELTGRNFAEFLDEKSFALGVEHYRRRQAGEDVPSRFEFGFIRKDGAKRLGEVKSTVFTDSSGRVNSLVQILDITERRRAENELRESEKKYRELVEYANSIILRMKRDGIVTFFNEYAENFFGYRRSEIIGRNVIGTIVPSGDSAGRDLEKMIADMGSDPDRYAFNENENVKKDGSRARIAWTNRLLPGETDAGDEILCVGTDITERARVEEQLRLQGMVLDQISDCVTVTDLGGRITYVNDAECRNLKLSREELLGKNVEAFGDDPEKGPTQKEILATTLSAGRYSGEVVNYDADGREIIMEFSTHLVRDSRGEPVALCGISSDITERKKAEQELREREEKFRALAEYSHNAIIIIDDGGVVTYVNDEMCRISGYSKEDIVGGPFAMAIAPESLETMAENFWRRQRGEDVPSRYEFYIVRKDGEKRLMEASATVFRDSAGRVNSIGQIIDITERRMAEDLLRMERDLGTALASADGLGRALEMVLDAVISIEGIDCGGVYTVDRETGEIDLVVHHNLSEEFVRAVSHYPPDSPQARKVAAGAPVYGSYEHIRTESNHVREREGLRAMAIVPVLHEGAPVALVNMASRGLQTIPEFVQRALETLAALAGGALARLMAEEKLLESESRFRALSDDNRAAVFMVQGDRFSYVNRAFRKMTGFDEDYIFSKKFWELFHPEEQETVKERGLARQRGEEPPLRYETRVLTKNGSSRWIEMNLSLVSLRGAPAIIGSAMDTTERRLHEQEMERGLIEKNTLLKEIHHRVKNNMQIITSLMNLQADSLEGDASKGIFDSCRSRVQSMALIHETLYSSSRFSDIDLKDYLERLVREIGMAYSRWDVTITLDAEPLRVDLDRAIPCGLILNELITNSLKHAFRDAGGAINISARTEGDKMRITVRDTGAGYQSGRAAGGLGMQLVDILTTQLRGEFSVKHDGGTVSVLTFQLEHGAARAE